MVYDCFPFFNELDILELRLNIMDDYVDYFVLSESELTFSGQKKPLYYNENKHLFQKFNDKIIHVVVPDGDLTINSFERDVYQKDELKNALKGCKDDDVIIFSDLDEIPNPDKIKAILADFNAGKIYHLAQRNFYFYLNYEETSGNLLSYTGDFEGIASKKWLGTKICSYKNIKNIPITDLRSPQAKKIGVRVENGGWHFTYMGGGSSEGVVAKIQHKIKSSSHQELNTEKILKNVEKKLSKNEDIFGRKAKFKTVAIDNTFPEYLIKNIEQYTHLIKKADNKKSLFSWLKPN